MLPLFLLIGSDVRRGRLLLAWLALTPAPCCSSPAEEALPNRPESRVQLPAERRDRRQARQRRQPAPAFAHPQTEQCWNQQHQRFGRPHRGELPFGVKRVQTQIARLQLEDCAIYFGLGCQRLSLTC